VRGVLSLSAQHEHTTRNAHELQHTRTRTTHATRHAQHTTRNTHAHADTLAVCVVVCLTPCTRNAQSHTHDTNAPQSHTRTHGHAQSDTVRQARPSSWLYRHAHTEPRTERATPHTAPQSHPHAPTRLERRTEPHRATHPTRHTPRHARHGAPDTHTRRTLSTAHTAPRHAVAMHNHAHATTHSDRTPVLLGAPTTTQSG
jgi:hypothetical protein